MAWCLVKHRDNFTFTLIGESVPVTKHHLMMACKRGKDSAPHILTSAVVREEWSVSLSGRFTSGEAGHSSVWIGG